MLQWFQRNPAETLDQDESGAEESSRAQALELVGGR